MSRHHPHPAAEIQISLEIYQQLLSAVISSNYQQEPWEVGEAAIRDWMTKHNPDSFAMQSSAGYQWKHLFLPSGTLLRTIFQGRNFHSRVEGDRLLYGGETVSPSVFANRVGGVRRNAWKVIWILYPNSSTWKSAAELRVRSGKKGRTQGLPKGR